MHRAPSFRPWLSGLGLLMIASALAIERRRVLLINLVRREFAPFDTFAGNFHTELVRQPAQRRWLPGSRLEVKNKPGHRTAIVAAVPMERVSS